MATAVSISPRQQALDFGVSLSVRFHKLEDLTPEAVTFEDKQSFLDYLRNYNKDNSFLLSLKRQAFQNPFRPMLSERQFHTGIRCVLQNFAKWLKDTNQFIQFDPALDKFVVVKDDSPEAKSGANEVAGAPAASQSTMIPVQRQAGIYTVVVNGVRRTLRFLPVQSNNPDEQRSHTISYLFGPNNEGDYRGFCYLMKDGSVRYWSKIISEDYDLSSMRSVLRLVVAEFLNPSVGTVVLEAAHCNRCGRLLTVDTSIYQGYGPECAKQVGIA